MTTVTQAVEALVHATVDLSDADLGRAWAWHEYDEEGLRFALLMAQHELRDLAVRLATMRREQPNQPQRILGQYHYAYRDLTGALAGMEDEDLGREPAPGEWPVREVLDHMLGADLGFLGAIQYARAPDTPRDAKAAEERWSSWRAEHGYRATPLDGGIAEVRDGLFAVHRRILAELADLTDADLDRSARFWDGEKPIRFRLHRFEAHYVQHTIQIDKTLDAIGRGPTEARRLVRVLYQDLASVELLSKVDGPLADEARQEVIRVLIDRAAAISENDVTTNG